MDSRPDVQSAGSGWKTATRCVRGRARAAPPSPSNAPSPISGAPTSPPLGDPDLVGLDDSEAALVAYCCAFRSPSAVGLLDLLDEPRREPLKTAAAAVARRDRTLRLELLARLLAPVWREGGERRLTLALGEEPAWLSCLVVPLTPRLQRPGSEAPPPINRAHPALSGLARRFVLRLLGG